MTTAQARAAGLGQRQLTTLVAHGWRRLTQGVYLMPNPADPFRSTVRGALLASPLASASEMTAGRLYGLWGLPRWAPSERPCLLLPDGRTYNARQGVKLRTGLKDGDSVLVDGIPTTSLSLTVAQLSRVLPADDLVCSIDSALRLGWKGEPGSVAHPRRVLLALALADVRSESPLETRLRVLLTRAGIPPEALQYNVYDDGGRFLARVDFAWPSIKLAVEVDGREYHESPQALFRDRERANDLVDVRWRVIRITWRDIVEHPDEVIRRIRRAITG